MSIREQENQAEIRDRWEASMLEARRLSCGPSDKKAADKAAKAARDAANDRGAEAWSPSRAREALRAWEKARYPVMSFCAQHAENRQAFESRESFDKFCDEYAIDCPIPGL